MSLLLDALKKAALEKQKRDQESQVVDSSSPAIPSASAEYKRDIFTKKISGSSAVHKNTEQTEELVFNIEETSIFTEQNEQLSLEKDIKEEIVQEKYQEPIKENSNISIPVEEKPTEKEALANLLESSRQTALSSAFTADGSQVPYSEKTVKAAFTQLLGRSHKAAIYQRKRMWIWLVSLSITSFFIVAGYYFFLFTAESSLQDSDSFVSAESTGVVERAVLQEEAVQEEAVQEEAVIAETSVIERSTEIAPLDVKENQVIADRMIATKNKLPAEKLIAPEKKPIQAVAKAETVRTAPEPAQQQTVIYTESGLDKFSKSIETGYAAYQAGNWMQAREAYAAALKIKPKHRDALLGSAAVALREKRYQEALRWYQERLVVDPKDSHALAGIMSLTAINSADSTQTNIEMEREINVLLQEYPQAAHLYFMKGSLDAVQQQWDSAQTAFFEAVSLDPINPDYTYNLAIALDHLTQPKEALSFYQKALALSQQHAISFDPQAVSRRIADLERTAELERAAP